MSICHLNLTSFYIYKIFPCFEADSSLVLSKYAKNSDLYKTIMHSLAIFSASTLMHHDPT